MVKYPCDELNVEHEHPRDGMRRWGACVCREPMRTERARPQPAGRWSCCFGVVACGDIDRDQHVQNHFHASRQIGRSAGHLNDVTSYQRFEATVAGVESNSDDGTASLRKPLPPHKQQPPSHPSGCSRSGGGSYGDQAASKVLSVDAGQSGACAGAVCAGSPASAVGGGRFALGLGVQLHLGGGAPPLASLVDRHRQHRLCCGEASVELLQLIQPFLDRLHSLSLSCR